MSSSSHLGLQRARHPHPKETLHHGQTHAHSGLLFHIFFPHILEMTGSLEPTKATTVQVRCFPQHLKPLPKEPCVFRMRHREGARACGSVSRKGGVCEHRRPGVVKRSGSAALPGPPSPHRGLPTELPLRWHLRNGQAVIGIDVSTTEFCCPPAIQ